MRIVIVGGGVVGTSIAYRLASRGAEVTLVERTAVACAASGKAGGFLARDWCDGGPLMALARRSFALHADLAGTLGGDWGHRALATYSGTLGRTPGGERRPGGLGWTSSKVAIEGRLGVEGTTAQVHPAAFTRAMMRAAEARGAAMRIGRVTDLLRRGETVVGVSVEGQRLAADAVVIAMGPWSVLASRWLPLPPVYGLKGHSLVFDTRGTLPPEALFLTSREADGEELTPEVFPRADGTTYVCAISSRTPLPLDPADVEPDAGAIDLLAAVCARISVHLADSPVLARQACYRPVTQDGLPLIGAVAGAPGAYVATGHGVWGILNAPATAEAMADLIVEGAARTVDLAPFDPGRLPALDPARLDAAERAR